MTHYRHILYYRPALKNRDGSFMEPVRRGAFSTYAEALDAGQQYCGHGKFWIVSQRKTSRSPHYVEFYQPSR